MGLCENINFELVWECYVALCGLWCLIFSSSLQCTQTLAARKSGYCGEMEEGGGERERERGRERVEGEG